MPLVRLALVLLFIAPFLELALLLRIASRLGLPLTLVWIGGTALVGWTLCRGLQARVLERLRQAAVAERIGGTQGVLFFEEVTSAALRGLAGILLILPGAITDVLGLLLLLPPLGLVALWGFRSVLSRSVQVQPGGGSQSSSRENSETSGGAGPEASEPTDPDGAGAEGGWVVRDVDFEIVGEEDEEGPATPSESSESSESLTERGEEPAGGG